MFKPQKDIPTVSENAKTEIDKQVMLYSYKLYHDHPYIYPEILNQKIENFRHDLELQVKEDNMSLEPTCLSFRGCHV